MRFALVAFAASWLAASGLDSRVVHAQHTDLLPVRIYVHWGSNGAPNVAPRIWRGQLELNAGHFQELQVVATDRRALGTIQLADQRVIIDAEQPIDFNGFEVDVVAPHDATLRLRLHGDEDQRETVVELPIKRLVNRPKPYERLAPNELLHGRSSQWVRKLDTFGNRVEVNTVPFDRLRISPERRHLVFEPNESWTPSIEALLPNLNADEHYVLRLQCLDDRNRPVTDEVTREVKTDGRGYLPPIKSLTLDLPESEGAYYAVVQLQRTTFGVTRTIAMRRFDLLVMAASRQPKDQPNGEVDLAERVSWSDPRWTDRIPTISLPGIPRDRSSDSVSSPGNEPWTTLAPGRWRAFPLSLEKSGAAHRISIDYMSDHPQQLVIAAVEANADGSKPRVLAESTLKVPNIRHVPDEDSDPGPRATHEFVFWPDRTDTWLVVINQGSTEARFGAAEVATFRAGLPFRTPNTTSNRLVTLYISQAHITDLLGIEEDDWSANRRAAERLTEFAAYAGYNSIALAINQDGGALYPSRVLGNLPSLDQTFFSESRQPLPKDLLELLYRQCNRTGLRLLPMLRLTEAFPRLEHSRRAARQPTHQRYHLLDAELQQEIERVMAEIVEAYGHHRSFAGIMLNARGDGYGGFHHLAQGLTARAISEFQNGVTEAQREGRNTVFDQDQLLWGSGQSAWIDWRCRQVAEFLSRLANRVGRQSRHRLYLITDDQAAPASGDEIDQLSDVLSAAGRDILPHNTQPMVTESADRLRGLDWSRLTAVPHLAVIAAQDTSPLEANSFAHPRHNRVADDRDSLPAGTLGLALQSRIVESHIPSLPARPNFTLPPPPFGERSESTPPPLVIRSVTTFPGPVNRYDIVQAWAERDLPIVLYGGDRLPFGQTDALRSLLQVMQDLPPSRFSDFNGTHDTTRSSPVPIRHRVVGNRAYFYLVNDSPIAFDVVLHVRTASRAPLQSLPSGRQDTMINRDGTIDWKVRLAPYDVAGAYIDDPRATIVFAEPQFPDSGQLESVLRDRLNAVDGRLTQLSLRETFESEPLGWQAPGEPAEPWRAMPDPQDPANATLQLQSQGGPVATVSPLWQLPATDRLSIRARVAAAYAGPPPRLSLIVNGATPGPGVRSDIPLVHGGWHETEELIVPRLPATSDNRYRVTFELQGSGTVQIDDLEISAFTHEERRELQKISTSASNRLRKHQFVESAKLLYGEWPCYLLREIPETSRIAAQHQAPRRALQRQTEAAKPKRSFWDRLWLR